MQLGKHYERSQPWEQQKNQDFFPEPALSKELLHIILSSPLTLPFARFFLMLLGIAEVCCAFLGDAELTAHCLSRDYFNAF